MKTCNKCPYSYFCWDDGNDYCYRDNEKLNDLELNTINAKKGLLRHKLDSYAKYTTPIMRNQ